MNKELAERSLEDRKKEADALVICRIDEDIIKIEACSFTRGFLIGLFISSVIWMGLIYLIFG